MRGGDDLPRWAAVTRFATRADSLDSLDSPDSLAGFDRQIRVL